jgi:hypothetical protein
MMFHRNFLTFYILRYLHFNYEMAENNRISVLSEILNYFIFSNTPFKFFLNSAPFLMQRLSIILKYFVLSKGNNLSAHSGVCGQLG